MPRVSVLLPSYNHEPFIDEAIASVLDQTFEDLELVIVDDGSTDASAERILGFTDRRIVTHLEQHRGAHAALNTAIELSSPSSDYLAILNSDDAYAPDRLETFVGLLDEQPTCSFGASLVEIVGRDGLEIRARYADALRVFRESERLEHALLRANFILTTSNLFVRRSLLERTGRFRPLRVRPRSGFLAAVVVGRGARIRGEGAGALPGSFGQHHRRDDAGPAAPDLRARLDSRGQDSSVPFRRACAGWICAYASGLVGCLPMPEIAAVATVLLPLRVAVESGRLPDQSAADDASSLLAEDHPAYKDLVAIDLDQRGRYIGDLQRARRELESELASRAEAQRTLEKEVAWRAQAQEALEQELAEVCGLIQDLCQRDSAHSRVHAGPALVAVSHVARATGGPRSDADKGV